MSELHRTVARVIVVSIIVPALWSSTARAGTITGTVKVETRDESTLDLRAPTVVWIEGIDGDSVPDDAVVIKQKNMAFVPDMAVVRVGQAVEMPNLDTFAHSAYSRSEGKQFDLGLYPKGTSKSITFDKPGVVDVECSMHRTMNCTLIVVPSRHYTIIEPESDMTTLVYEMPDVPAGTYTVRAWHQQCVTSIVTIVVGDDETNAGDIKLKERTPRATQKHHAE